MPSTAAKIKGQVYGKSLVTQKSRSHLDRCSRNEQLQVRRDQLCHTEVSPYPPNGKEKLLEKPSNTAFPTISKGRVSLACGVIPWERRLFQRDQAQLPGLGEDEILSIPHTLFQSLVTPENSKAFLF